MVKKKQRPSKSPTGRSKKGRDSRPRPVSKKPNAGRDIDAKGSRQKPGEHMKTYPNKETSVYQRRFHPLPAPVIVFIVGSILLFWNLDARYLWQDEAATAVLAKRMLSTGRPLAYDGVNLITMDRYFPGEGSILPTKNAKEAVDFFVRRKDFKADTTWIGQPWGQFIVAGMSLALFGDNTVAARLPFALAGAMTATLLFVMVRKRFSSSVPAIVAVALLLGNTFWFLHMRQCRYYALSALFLLLTMGSYLRWQEGNRWGAPVFIGSAWIWFHQDFGSIWPVLLILALDAAIVAGRHRLRNTVFVFTSLGLIIAPWIVYYNMVGRLHEPEAPWIFKTWNMLSQMNQFQLPLILVPVAVFFLWRDRHKSSEAEGRRLVSLSIAIIAALTVWMSTVGPLVFYV